METIHQQILLDVEKVKQLETLVTGLAPGQLNWLSGFMSGLAYSLQTTLQPGITTHQITGINGTTLEGDTLAILYGSRTGNGTWVANRLQERLNLLGIKSQLKDLNEYPVKQLKNEKFFVIIVSTHGDGVPPTAAEDIYSFLHNKNAPPLTAAKYAVLALGDSSYVHFCKTGKDIDLRLEELGAQRIHPRCDCDVDFQDKAEEWIEGIVRKIKERKPVAAASPFVQKTNSALITSTYSRRNPYESRLMEKIRLSGRGSGKETFHLEFSIENSGLNYEPGDAIGIYGFNPERIVNELIGKLKLNPDEEVETGNQILPLKTALKQHCELSVLSGDVLANYNKIANNSKLATILSDADQQKEYTYGRDIVDLMNDFPAKLTAAQLTGTLRKMQPRLYSISSSLKLHPDEVHIIVAALRYQNTRYKEGACSTYLTDRLASDELIRVFIEKNPDFRLPKNPDTPIIMIGPGTGVAPFRAFIEERAALGIKGKSWLFFGERNFATDFSYQTEFQKYLKKGDLTKLNVAFSRDSDKKVYVQHKMKDYSRELYNWMEEGAHIYICGDMKNMANDVIKTLNEIIGKEANLNAEHSEKYLQKIKKQKRLAMDVY